MALLALDGGRGSSSGAQSARDGVEGHDDVIDVLAFLYCHYFSTEWEGGLAMIYGLHGYAMRGGERGEGGNKVKVVFGLTRIETWECFSLIARYPGSVARIRT